MRSLCGHGKYDVRYELAPDPRVEHPHDALLRVGCCAISGSDLHLYDGYLPGMASGEILGPEFMGEVVEVGAGVSRLRPGDRVVVPFTVSCGECEQCMAANRTACERSNRNRAAADKAFGHALAGIYGTPYLMGGYPGGRAELVRIAHADANAIKLPDSLTDEQGLLLGGVFPAGWQAARQCMIKPSDTVAVWGAGPAGQFAVRAAIMLGARQVIAIDSIPERLIMAKAAGAMIIDFDEGNVVERLNDLTGGKGPEKCIDAVGLEAHALRPADSLYDRARQVGLAESDHPHTLRDMIYACWPAGVLSVAGVYAGMIDRVPFGR